MKEYTFNYSIEGNQEVEHVTVHAKDYISATIKIGKHIVAINQQNRNQGKRVGFVSVKLPDSENITANEFMYHLHCEITARETGIGM